MSDTTETVYTRSPDVVWRLGPDRVLVGLDGSGRQVVERASQPRTVESVGPAALVWIALDDPASTEAELVHLEEVRVEIGEL